MTLPLIHLLQQGEDVGEKIVRDIIASRTATDEQWTELLRPAQGAPLDRLRLPPRRRVRRAGEEAAATRFRRAPSATRSWRCPTTCFARPVKPPADRIRELRDGDPPPRRALLHPQRPGNLRRGVRPAAARARTARGRASRISSRPIRRPSASAAGRRGFATVEHLAPMLSLDNAYNEDELRAFDERVRKGAGLGDAAVAYVAELKIDGLSIALTYEDGRARARRDARRRRARRRGHGQRPDDSRDAAAPARRARRAHRSARRGVSAARAFARMNREREEAGEPLFANPRNAAAGTMRNLDPALVSKRGLSARSSTSWSSRRTAGPCTTRTPRSLTRAARRGDCRSNRTGGAATASTR